jgi:hypothetical protein
MATPAPTPPIDGCAIGPESGYLRARVAGSRADDVQECYRAIANECIQQGCRRLLIVGRSVSDAFAHLAGRDALRSMALAGVPAGFRLAFIAGTPDLIAIYDTAVVEARRLGIEARRFTAEKDAVAWLSE